MRLADVATVFKQTLSGFGRHRVPQLAAAIAFYTIFSLAPTLLIVVAVAEKVFRQRDEIRREIVLQFEKLVGAEGAQQIQNMMDRVDPNWSGLVPTIIGLATLLFGATAVFIQLRNALNVIWDAPKPPPLSWRVILRFIKTRLVSLAMILSIAFMLFVSLVLSAIVSAAAAWLGDQLPIPPELISLANFLVSTLVISALFAAIYKFMPEVHIAWRDVRVGAIATTLFLYLGKTLVGVYMARSTVASVYGAAGSVIVILLWVYYSALIFLFGAEFTAAWARVIGSRKNPDESTPPSHATPV
ncbi:MAG: YihY/virulence factor BrkB family protein [Phycisphaerales bacterium]